MGRKKSIFGTVLLQSLFFMSLIWGIGCATVIAAPFPWTTFVKHFSSQQPEAMAKAVFLALSDPESVFKPVVFYPKDFANVAKIPSGLTFLSMKPNKAETLCPVAFPRSASLRWCSYRQAVHYLMAKLNTTVFSKVVRSYSKQFGFDLKQEFENTKKHFSSPSNLHLKETLWQGGRQPRTPRLMERWLYHENGLEWMSAVAKEFTKRGLYNYGLKVLSLAQIVDPHFTTSPQNAFQLAILCSNLNRQECLKELEKGLVTPSSQWAHLAKKSFLFQNKVTSLLEFVKTTQQSTKKQDSEQEYDIQFRIQKSSKHKEIFVRLVQAINTSESKTRWETSILKNVHLETRYQLVSKSNPIIVFVEHPDGRRFLFALDLDGDIFFRVPLHVLKPGPKTWLTLFRAQNPQNQAQAMKRFFGPFATWITSDSSTQNRLLLLALASSAAHIKRFDLCKATKNTIKTPRFSPETLTLLFFRNNDEFLYNTHWRSCLDSALESQSKNDVILMTWMGLFQTGGLSSLTDTLDMLSDSRTMNVTPPIEKATAFFKKIAKTLTSAAKAMLGSGDKTLEAIAQEALVDPAAADKFAALLVHESSDLQLEKRIEAADLLRKMGHSAISAIPSLKSWLRHHQADPVVYAQMVHALFEIDEEELMDNPTALAILLKTGDMRVQRRVVMILKQNETNSDVDGTVKHLSQMLDNFETKAYSSDIVHALGTYGKQAKGALSKLTTLMNDATKNLDLRLSCATAIMRIDPRKGRNVAIPFVFGILNSSSTADQARALVVLRTLTAITKFSISTLKALIKDETAPVVFRIRIAEILGLMDANEAIKTTVPLLVSFLRSTPSSHPIAADVLGHLGKSASSAVPALKKCLKHKNPRWRASAATALAKIAPKETTAAVLSTLLPLVRHPAEDIRTIATEGLGVLKAQEAGPRLLSLFGKESTSATERGVIWRALAQINSSEVLKTVVQMLDHKKQDVRLSVLDLLGNAQAQEAVPHIIKHFSKPAVTDQERLKVLDALGQIGSKDAVPFLSDLEKNARPPLLRIKARRCLKQIKTQNRPQKVES